MTQPIKVLIVDDSSFMRSMLKRLIEKDQRFEVVGQAKDGQEGVALSKSLQPDVVTMDVEMPVMDGITALTHIMAQDPRPVVMVSSLTEEGAAATLEAMAKGAIDFIPKSLQDNDKNILKAAGNLHEKLMTAAQANVRGSSPAAQPAPPVPPRAPTPIARPGVSAPQGAAASGAASPAPAAPAAGGASKYKCMVIGASTGGPRCLQDLLPAVPAFNIPALLIQHMPPAFTGPMAERLNKLVPYEVVEIKDRQTLRPGVLHVAPGGMHLRVENLGGGLVVSVREDQGESPYKPSVNVAAESLRNLFQGNVLAVMLTGMGDDGAREFKQLKDAGGHVIAQDAATSVVYGMPKAVVAAGAASEELPLNQIGPRIGQLLSGG